MAKSPRRKKARPAKVGRPPSRRPRRQPARRGQGHGEPDLMDDVRAALADDEPLPLLGLVSSLLSAFEDRPSFGRPAEPEMPPREEVLQSFFEVDMLETSALLAGIAGLAGEEVLRHRVRREIGARNHVLPRWLVALDEARVSGRVVQVAHVLGDGDNVMFGVQLPGGPELSVVVYVDHNLGTLVKDAFVVPAPPAELVEQMRAAAGGDPDTTFTDLDPADARARLTEAIDLGEMTVPPLVTDSWPASRPLVRWAVGLLPEGGTGYRRPEWPEKKRQALVKRFFSSRFGTDLDDADHRALLESFVWFGTGYGPGDPLRWSPVAVEMLLVDWIPRKIVAEASYLSRAPDLLRAFVRFCHAERGIRPELTTQTLAAVDRFEPEYRTAIRTPRPQGPAALLAAMGAVGPDGSSPSADELKAEFDAVALDGLRQAVGGAEALDRLDADPLPDEPFAWDAVPTDVHDQVADVLALVDRCCTELLDDLELRTAARRLLARLAAADPRIFRRGSRADTAAASICWIVAKANEVFENSDLAVKDLMGWFGVGASTPSQRGKTMLRALGAEPNYVSELSLDLGSSAYLTGEHRARIIAARDRLR